MALMRYHQCSYFASSAHFSPYLPSRWINCYSARLLLYVGFVKYIIAFRKDAGLFLNNSSCIAINICPNPATPIADEQKPIRIDTKWKLNLAGCCQLFLVRCKVDISYVVLTCMVSIGYISAATITRVRKPSFCSNDAVARPKTTIRNL